MNLVYNDLLVTRECNEGRCGNALLVGWRFWIGAGEGNRENGPFHF